MIFSKYTTGTEIIKAWTLRAAVAPVAEKIMPENRAMLSIAVQASIISTTRPFTASWFHATFVTGISNFPTSHIPCPATVDIIHLFNDSTSANRK
jgi:hypothetical protein